MAGIIFAPGQRRTVNLMTALKIRDRLDGNIPLYGVFVNQNVMDMLTFFLLASYKVYNYTVMNPN
ncbi:Phosphoribosylanthranilate isomerase [Leuconostoc gelidum subsp. gasicomitatum]|uniref:Phosphoribosylanthranilate isomerase n=1 Tax=Leuconostoc gasicomitatum TaxID=115778 RepID=A0ABP2B2T4_9LACO|nr:Phosphoribosylanthranilate isomerase [Leuconostoc gasicomitatum]